MPLIIWMNHYLLHLYDYFAYLDLIIFLYIFNDNDRASYNKKHQQQIENIFAHASSSSGGARNMTVYNHRINDDIGNLLHYFSLCKSCLWYASYIHHISNMANPDFADILIMLTIFESEHRLHATVTIRKLHL